ncbi:MAG: hypothetical protein E7773_00640 [Sphingomonas sp.]|uniref:hypothetical protein n=1 Tax=Sphingomonas sp. TaxID=28214 RepID=UPI0012221BBB|nr:hypothetical protein [Sphingomonas sp.]THD38295.1 MAG: hypothetical protein E7773_00640 [Sphingomonas sp.]
MLGEPQQQHRIEHVERQPRRKTEQQVERQSPPVARHDNRIVDRRRRHGRPFTSRQSIDGIHSPQFTRKLPRPLARVNGSVAGTPRFARLARQNGSGFRNLKKGVAQYGSFVA